MRRRGPWLATTALAVAGSLVVVVACTSAPTLHPAASGAAGRSSSDATGGTAGVTRTHFIAADTIEWDYASSGADRTMGTGFEEDAAVYVTASAKTIGRRSTKSQYREYTDATFTERAPVPAAWQHLGLLGPVLHAEVGDTLSITFRNNTPFPASMHPHGVFYDKASEGAPYDDGAPEDAGDAVAPGATVTYEWKVPERAGPGPMDGSSVMWMYHSHVAEVSDVYAGLLGPIIVTRRGQARPDGSPADVDRELVATFFIDNENESPWVDRNIAERLSPPPAAGATFDKTDADFVEGNLKHTINGYLWGNGPGFSMRTGERVRWYVMGMGSEGDLHTPHWHGNTVLAMGMRTDVVSLLPATMVIADMVPDDPGRWLFHCHVADHLEAGMSTTYRVEDS